jgi:hypothetical protein
MTPDDQAEIRPQTDRITAEAERYIESGWAPRVLAGALWAASLSLLEQAYGRAALRGSCATISRIAEALPPPPSAH